jgi:hypothetical protein
VVLTPRLFEKHGTAERWLMSEAFDMPSSRPIAYEELLHKASKLLEMPEPDRKKIKSMNKQLVLALSPTDDFLFNWRYVCKSKGWLE